MKQDPLVQEVDELIRQRFAIPADATFDGRTLEQCTLGHRVSLLFLSSGSGMIDASELYAGIEVPSGVSTQFAQRAIVAYLESEPDDLTIDCNRGLAALTKAVPYQVQGVDRVLTIYPFRLRDDCACALADSMGRELHLYLHQSFTVRDQEIKQLLTVWKANRLAGD